MVGRVLCLSLVVVAVGCAAGPITPPPPSVVETSVDAPDALVSPTTTISITLSEAPDAGGAGAAIVIVEGLADADLIRAIEKGDSGDPSQSGSIAADLRDRTVPTRVSVEYATLRVLPSRPMAPDTLHTLVVARTLTASGQRLPRTLVRAFRTAGAGSGQPWWTLEAPRTGAVDVVRNLREVVVGFSRPVSFVDGDSLQLVDDEGRRAAASVTAASPPIRFHLRLERPLAPLSHYRVLALPAILDDDGEAPFALDPPPSFTTGSALRRDPPAIDHFALSASSGCLVARFTTASPAAARLCVDGDCSGETGMLALHELSHPLPAGASAGVTVFARDESTAPESKRGPLAAPPSSPRTLTITEVLSRPKGARLSQQFVEVENRGVEPVALGGLLIEDDAGADELPDATLMPGAFALIVPADFESDDGLDIPPVPGTLLVHIGDGTIGKNGIRETGEALALTEADGRPVSKFSTVGLKLAAGQSARRALFCDVTSAYEATPSGGATPGGW